MKYFRPSGFIDWWKIDHMTSFSDLTDKWKSWLVNVMFNGRTIYIEPSKLIHRNDLEIKGK